MDRTGSSPDTGSTSSLDGPVETIIALSSSVGQGIAQQDDASSRQKKWATKVRTGCLTCRARRIKCDEAKPACHRCVKSGHMCRGYSIAAPSKNAPVRFTVAIEPKKTQHTQEHTSVLPSKGYHDIPAEAVPPDFIYMEAFRYFYTVVQPGRGSELDLDEDQHLPSARTSVRSGFILSQITHRMLNAAKLYGRSLRPGEDPAFKKEWQAFYYWMSEFIGIVNECIMDKGFYGGRKGTLSRIVDLVAHDLELHGDVWRVHTEGFLLFLKHEGGVPALLLRPRPPLYQCQFLFIHAFTANTTSPALNQLNGLAQLNDTDIRAITGYSMFIDNPCPTDLFLEVIHITRLRVLVAEGARLQTIVQPLADDILGRIQSFDPDNWKEAFQLPDAPIIPLMARAFKTAAMLYGILTLPAYTVLSWTAAVGIPGSYQKLVLLYRTQLLAQARAAWTILKSRSAMGWPLIVAGVALADNWLPEDREFVIACITEIWMHPNAYCGPRIVLGKLKVFWESGKTGWEDCFDEPISPVA